MLPWGNLGAVTHSPVAAEDAGYSGVAAHLAFPHAVQGAGFHHMRCGLRCEIIDGAAAMDLGPIARGRAPATVRAEIRTRQGELPGFSVLSELLSGTGA